MNYFILTESTVYPNKFEITLNYEKFKFYKISGSFNVAPARILGLEYADYLRYCRDVCGAQLYGKNRTYPTAHFDDNEETKNLLYLLNKRTEEISNKIHDGIKLC